jgi:hypothetical protein
MCANCQGGVSVLPSCQHACFAWPLPIMHHPLVLHVSEASQLTSATTYHQRPNDTLFDEVHLLAIMP